VKLLALSDLHVGFVANRAALEALPPSPRDWLILAGDVGETEAHLAYTLRLLRPRFAQLVWVPGNHELWTPHESPAGPRGVDKYERLVALCRREGVLTPEDPYVAWPGVGPAHLIAPAFALYDYSFRPDDVSAERALDWAAESNIMCADEALLYPDPYPSREAWCHARCDLTEARLAAAAATGRRLVLINHWPLRADLLRLLYIPRFSLWCGTRRTRDWHVRFGASVVVYGHMHVPYTTRRDGVRFEEVSFGYPRERERRSRHAIETYVRQILPEPEPHQAGPLDPALRHKAPGWKAS